MGWLRHQRQQDLHQQRPALRPAGAGRQDRPGGRCKGVSLFLVDTKSPGFTRGQNLEKIGQHAGDTSELFFNDLRVPADALLGGVEGQGFVQMMRELPRDASSSACRRCMGPKGALDATVKYVQVQERQAFRPGDWPVPEHALHAGAMRQRHRRRRGVLNASVAAYERGELTPRPRVRSSCTPLEVMGRVADACLQLFGGYGYMAEYPISRFWTDARVLRIYGGTSGNHERAGGALVAGALRTDPRVSPQTLQKANGR